MLFGSLEQFNSISYLSGLNPKKVMGTNNLKKEWGKEEEY